MKYILTFLLSLIFVIGSHTTSYSATNKDSLAHLNLHLVTIEDSARNQRYWGGGSLLVLSGGLAVGAIILSNSDDDDFGPVLLGVMSGIFGITGAATLLWKTDYETLPERYRNLPEKNQEEINLKVTTGENYLDTLGTRSRTGRFTSGGVFATLGVAQLIWYAASKDKDQNDFLIYTGTTYLGLGLVTLLIKQEAETQKEQYQAWKNQKKSWLDTVEVAMTPIKKGMGLNLRWTF